MHAFSKAPSLHRPYPASTATMGLSDSRHDRSAGYVFPSYVLRLRSPPCRASQAPRLIFPRALSPTTPEGPLAALACCFTNGLVWLHPSRRTGHLRFPIEAESGSLALRLACSPPDLPVPSLRLALVRLHAEQAIYTVNSFQFTRSARLILAYRPRGSGVFPALRTTTPSRSWLSRSKRNSSQLPRERCFSSHIHNLPHRNRGDDHRPVGIAKLPPSPFELRRRRKIPRFAQAIPRRTRPNLVIRSRQYRQIRRQRVHA